MNITQDEMLRIATDRRLKAVDIRILIYLISSDNTKLNQQDLADLLDVTRENLNRSIQKLKALGYLKLIKSNAHLNNFEDYIKIPCINRATNKEVEIRKKLKSNKMIYKIDLNIVTQMKLEQLMELCNIDVKNSKNKFVLEDDATIDLDTDEDVSIDFMPFCTLTKRSDLFDLFDLYKLYNKKIHSIYLDDNSIDIAISIDDALLFLSCTELFRNDFKNHRILDIISNFRLKYLDLMIAYYMKNTDILNRDFFLKYNKINKEFISNREVNSSHIMQILGYSNRETSRVVSRFRLELINHNIPAKEKYTFIECLDIISKINQSNFYKDAIFNMDLKDLEDIYCNN
ncbi:MarR family transcriptional regulator (plasmid) [Paraclostridium tenue]